MDYRIVNMGENSVGGLMALTKDMADHGARPTWLGYFAVDYVDATVAQIEKKGGTVQMPAMDIPMVGRISMVADPQGATFYVMKPTGQGKSKGFADDCPRVGHCAWNELRTSDQPGAWTFDGELFGWKKEGQMDMGPLGQYEFIRHGGMIGAFMPSSATMGPPRWAQYFRVHDIDAAKKAVEGGGGTVVQGPDEIPGGDFSMNCIGQQAAEFG